MTTIEVTIPDELAQEAQQAGLLSPDRIESLLREQLRHQRLGDFFASVDRANANSSPALSPEEVALELTAMRADKRKAA